MAGALTAVHDHFRKPTSTQDQVRAGFFGIMLWSLGKEPLEFRQLLEPVEQHG
jgi:hypothetical protein